MTKKTANSERVEVFVPKGTAGDEANLFVSVNGVNYLLPRGKKSLVPFAVAEEINRANEAAEEREKRIDELLKAK